MTMTTVNLRLSSDLIQKARTLMGESGNLDAFVTDAIAHEIERRQQLEPGQDFWETVAQIQNEIKSEGLELDPDEIWNNVSAPSSGREVIL